ncbi:cytochrome P450 [Xylariaceae sp. FL0594]|nr:cytochrome P450 [Xylariaceae sp. FL0594]
MGYKITSLLLGLVLWILTLVRRQRERRASAQSRGCEPAVVHQPVEPFSGFDFQMRMYSHIPFLHQLHQKYGETYEVRTLVSLPTVCTIVVDNIRAVNTSRDFGVEPMRLPGLEQFCGKGFITTDGPVRKQARKLLKPSFDMNSIRDLTVLRSEVDKLLQQLPKDGSTADLQPLLYVVFLNTALHFVLGVDPSAQSSDAPLTPDAFVKSFHSSLVYSMYRVMLGPAWKLVPKKGYIESCTRAHNYLDYYISQAFASGEEQKTKSLIKELSVQTDDAGFIRSQVIQAMMAAQDTTSELLTNSLFVLARHPEYWRQLRVEFSGLSEDDLRGDRLLGSKLTANILHETLRLHPIFPLLGRIALRDTTLPVGGGPDQDRPIFVPEGSTVVLAYYSLHRDPSVFGDDVEVFRPERWDSIKPDQWQFLGFGGGNRACLGQHKAMMEAAFVLARFSQSFERLESRDTKDWQGELKLTCKSANGCKVALH